MFILLVWLGVLIAALTIYFRQVYSEFDKYGIKYLKPIPLLGNMGPFMTRKMHFTTMLLNFYRDFPEEKFLGSYQFMTPNIFARDIELVKKIAVKDYEHFLDHRNNFENNDTFWTRSLLFLKGQEWKDMRSTLSPAFTSAKIRLMVPFMVEVGEQMISDFKQKIESSNGYIDVDCKDLSSRYATDVIASCAFGIKVNSFTERNNEFHTIGKDVTGASFGKMMRALFITKFPRIAKILNLDLMPEAHTNFFFDLIMCAIKDRKLRHIVRPDIIHLLMEAKDGKLSHENVHPGDKTTGFASVDESSVGTKKVNREWSDSDLVAQAVLFFLAGFDTISTTMSFLLYELAVNPDVQEKLAQEIKEADIKNDGNFDLQSIQSMTYLDMVVSELLRLWPPAPALERLCISDYNLGKPNEKAPQEYIIRKGISIMIPVISFHRDPQYFSNPDKFDPERFSSENLHKIQSGTYLPFGLGPRNCIGSRFALCEVKVMTYQILRHLEVSPCEKTCIPAELDPASFAFALKGGHWLRFKIRT